MELLINAQFSSIDSSAQHCRDGKSVGFHHGVSLGRIFFSIKHFALVRWIISETLYRWIVPSTFLRSPERWKLETSLVVGSALLILSPEQSVSDLLPNTLKDASRAVTKDEKLFALRVLGILDGISSLHVNGWTSFSQLFSFRLHLQLRLP